MNVLTLHEEKVDTSKSRFFKSGHIEVVFTFMVSEKSKSPHWIGFQYEYPKTLQSTAETTVFNVGINCSYKIIQLVWFIIVINKSISSLGPKEWKQILRRSVPFGTVGYKIAFTQFHFWSAFSTSFGGTSLKLNGYYNSFYILYGTTLIL